MRSSASWIGCLVVLVVAACAPAASQTRTTALFMDSEPGDWVGGGITQTYACTPDATFQHRAAIPPTVSFWPSRTRIPVVAHVGAPGNPAGADGLIPRAHECAIYTLRDVEHQWRRAPVRPYRPIRRARGIACTPTAASRVSRPTWSNVEDGAPALFAAGAASAKFDDCLAEPLWRRFLVRALHPPPLHGAVAGGDISPVEANPPVHPTFVDATSIS